MDREINSDVCLLKVEDVKSVVISGLRNLVLIDKKPTVIFASFFSRLCQCFLNINSQSNYVTEHIAADVWKVKTMQTLRRLLYFNFYKIMLW